MRGRRFTTRELIENEAPRGESLGGRVRTNITPYNQPIGTESVNVVPQNLNRNYLMIQNNSANTIYVNFGNRATTNDLQITPNGNYELLVAPVNQISLLASAAGSNVVILEGNEVFK